ncbi:hypothetical protein K466DRAFT_655439 [Polyporus arcularius HHB13444]|uniref:F-box domain-containing protein n=1 Tax=Polyporus arcularius HHB13444 TaxID=1314778 RepID=A0A5C3P160_9APHY|nr:hypothetical protein K466DRAFT_655439 [Polyporus arcularius HHB13444]
MPSRDAPAATSQSPTRNRQHEALVARARTTRIHNTARIVGLDQLQLFISLATVNPVIGHAVQDLTLSLPLHIGYPAQAVRECLRLTPNLDTLMLVLPDFSPSTIISGTLLPRLRTFATNLPHRALPVFLALHPSVTSLALESCGGRTRCPLRDLNLSQVSDLSCPARCLEGIARGQVAMATVNLTRLASMAALAIQALSTSPLYLLCINFFSDDYDILARIVAAAPRLRKLKLVEKPRAQRRFHHARRPWNDLQEWHRLLMRLPFLEEFMLRTSASISSPRRSEQAVVTIWANGTNHGARHPNLYHISILQQGPDADAQPLSHYFRRHGTWQRVNEALVNAAHSFTM